jgi:hypothetical protein
MTKKVRIMGITPEENFSVYTIEVDIGLEDALLSAIVNVNSNKSRGRKRVDVSLKDEPEEKIPFWKKITFPKLLGMLIGAGLTTMLIEAFTGWKSGIREIPYYGIIGAGFILVSLIAFRMNRIFNQQEEEEQGGEE